MLMASSSKALGKTTGCVQKAEILYNKGRTMPRNKAKPKRSQLAPQSYACTAILTDFG